MPSLTTILPCGPTLWPPLPANVCPNNAVVPNLVPGDPLALLNRVVFTHNPTLKNFEPRVGFAWDPFHNGKTSVRGGFGIFDALPLPYELVFNATSTIPFNNPFLYRRSGRIFSPPNQEAGYLANPAVAGSGDSRSIPIPNCGNHRRSAWRCDYGQGIKLCRARSEAKLRLSMELQHPAANYPEHVDPGGVCGLARVP